MRTSLHQQQEISGRHAASFGRVGRCINAASIESATRSSANDAIAVPAEMATALRAQAANGFGDAPLTVSDYWQRSRTRLEAAARAHRSRVVGDVLACIAHGIVERVRRLAHQLERRSQVRATALTLAALDSHTLRDLGFHRSEIRSVAAELGGDVQTTRVRVALNLRGR